MGDMFGSWSFFGSGQEDDLPEFEPASSLAAKGMEEYAVGNYTSAFDAFQEIIDRYPFSPEAMLAELKAADCRYYSGAYQEAKELYKQFEEKHPTNEAIPYTMFQVGMCDMARTDSIDRDPSGAHEAIKSFSQLLRVYPDSPYTTEAKARIRSAREFIVNHEYYVAVFYVRSKKYKAAQHRLKHLISTYPEASIIPKAQKLLDKLKAGDPPKWGLSRWLPEMSAPDLPDMSSWLDTGKEAEAGREEGL